MSKVDKYLKDSKTISISKDYNFKVVFLFYLGNKLGPETLVSLSNLLKTNDTIRLIDL